MERAPLGFDSANELDFVGRNHVLAEVVEQVDAFLLLQD
jgi:hypothetical protein